MKSVLNRMLTFVLIFISGSIFMVEYLYPLSYIVIFLILLFFNIFKLKKSVYFIDVLFIVLLVVLNLTTILYANDNDFTSYLGSIISIFIAFLASRLLSKKYFVSSYIKIITFLSFLSVIFFIFGLLNPSIIVENVKHISGKQNIDYYNIFLHVYHYSENASSLFNRIYIDPRNSSIFWEPGVFQAFININIYFILKDISLSSRRKLIFLFANIIALITTYSITGYFLFIFIIFEYLYYIFKDSSFMNTKKMYIVLFSTILFLLTFYFGGFSIIISRIQYYGNNIVDFMKAIVNRTYLSNLSIYKDKLHYLLFGLGYSFERYPNANSIVEMIIVNGIIYSSIILIYLWIKTKINFKKSTLFIIILLICITEPLLFRPIFLFFLFMKEEI